MASRTLSTFICKDFDIRERSEYVGCSICISQEGQVFSFGSSSHYAHGHQENHISAPTVISSLKNIQSVDCGLLHTVCLDYNGVVFTFGLLK